METLLDPGRRLVPQKKSLLWKSRCSSAVNLLTDRTLQISVLHSKDHSECTHQRPRTSRQFDSLPWESAKPQDKACFWERIEAPLPKCNFIHPRQLSPFPERLELPLSTDEILSGYEDIVFSGTDLFTAWVKMSEHEILVQHLVDTQKATAEFREKTRYFLSHEQFQQRLCDPFDCAEETQHLQLQPWTPSVKRRCPSNNTLQEGGISSPCRRRLTTLTTSFSRIAST